MQSDNCKGVLQSDKPACRSQIDLPCIPRTHDDWSRNVP